MMTQKINRCFFLLVFLFLNCFLLIDCFAHRHLFRKFTMGSSQSSGASIAASKYHGLTEAETVGKDFASECVNKHIIVTGANVGLGLETARVLALNGAEVILCSRNMKNGEDAVQKIKGIFNN